MISVYLVDGPRQLASFDQCLVVKTFPYLVLRDMKKEEEETEEELNFQHTLIILPVVAANSFVSIPYLLMQLPPWSMLLLLSGLITAAWF